MPRSDATVFPFLAEPARYTPCQWEIAQATPRLDYWLALFRRHFATLLEEAAREEADRKIDANHTARRVPPARDMFHHYLDQLAAQANRFGRLDILRICVERERILRQFDFPDPYRLPKTRENELALRVLPALLAELDALPDRDRFERITLGIFAGNIFDLGATQTAALFTDASVDFHAVRKQLAPRPWLIDDFDAWIAAIERKMHRAAVLFVDNAGSDVLLGMLPLARELVRRGTHVILTSNATPTLNDITHDELTALMPRIAAMDSVFANALRDGRLELITSGNGYPLIDLRTTSAALCEACLARGVDLVVLEGMGRAVESNLTAKFTCDVMKIAMVKDIGVAEELGGKVYDLVLRFEPG